MDFNVETVVAGASLIWNIWSTFKKRQYKKTLAAVVDGVEMASREGVISPKAAIQANAVAKGVLPVLNKMLDEKGRRVRATASPFTRGAIKK